MTDRELLELAAKAADIGNIQFHNGLDDDGCDDGRWAYTWMRDSSGKLVDWNPLTDDGDALRLAVKLNISLLFGMNYVIAGYVQIPTVNNANDPYAATRRAIVRAAAEIGKGMK